MAVQADGKIVVAGYTATTAADVDFALVRYNANGTLDNTFGTGGKVVTSFGPSTDRVQTLAIQADSKIVAAGDSDRAWRRPGIDFALARYNVDGGLDAGFGNRRQGDHAIRTLGARDSVYALLLQPVGGETRIVAVGGEATSARHATPPTARSTRASAAAARSRTCSSPRRSGAARAVTLVADTRSSTRPHPRGPRPRPAERRRHAGRRLRHRRQGRHAAGGGQRDEANSIVRQADGKLLVGGWVYAGRAPRATSRCSATRPKACSTPPSATPAR